MQKKLKKQTALPFVQWEKSSLTAWRKLNSMSPTATNLLTVMIEYMDKSNALVMSQNTMSEILECSRPTIARAISLLKDGNWIDTVRVGSATAYIIDQRVFWQQARKNKKYYADFTARVIASETEQDVSLSELTSDRKLRRMPRKKDAENLTILDDEEPPSQHEMPLISASVDD